MKCRVPLFLFPFLRQACLSCAGSTGSRCKRLPVAAKIALPTAGITAHVPGSPMPPGRSVLRTIWV
jgi:hypothetical protein